MSSHLLLHLIFDTSPYEKQVGILNGGGGSSECQEPWIRVCSYMGMLSFPLGWKQLGERGTQVKGQRPEARGPRPTQ